MGRWIRYSVFFLISGVIHLFICVDFLKLKTVVPTLNVEPLVETFRQVLHSSPENAPLNSTPSSLSASTTNPSETLSSLSDPLSDSLSKSASLNPSGTTHKEAEPSVPPETSTKIEPTTTDANESKQILSEASSLSMALSVPNDEKNQKIRDLPSYEAYLQQWFTGFTLPETWPPIRLISETSTTDLIRREKKQGYQIICYPQKDPQYFIKVSADSSGQLSYEKRVDTYTLKAKYSGTLRENSPLFQRVIAEVGSNTQLYHPREGSLIVLHLVPKKLERYFAFKQHLAATQLGIQIKEIQALVGSFRETVFEYDVFIFSGILTRDGRKLYPKDPESELLEFK